MTNFSSQLSDYINELHHEFDQIPHERKAVLEQFSKYIQQQYESKKEIKLNFICTHNSRRSHISQIWAATAIIYHQLDHISTYSGGTEATAFNPRAVAALERAGFEILNPGGDNPHYLVKIASGYPALECFSKTFDDPFNPSRDFAAIMTCSHADVNCPFIPGAAHRISLTYEDPKVADNTDLERAKYDERVRQIGRELLYAFDQIKR